MYCTPSVCSLHFLMCIENVSLSARTPVYKGKVDVFVPFSRNNHRMLTPKTIYILNQHDRVNVLGHFLSGLGPWVECRNRFVNQGVKEVFITEKQAQLTVPRHFWGWTFSPHCKLEAKEVTIFDIAKCTITGQHKAHDLAKRVWLKASRGKTNFMLRAKCVLSAKHVQQGSSPRRWVGLWQVL